MKQELIVTDNQSKFKGIPIVNTYITNDIEIPTNVEFGTTYYKYCADRKQLIAFKIFAISYERNSRGLITRLYLVKFAGNSEPVWMHGVFIGLTFKTINDFRSYQSGGSGLFVVKFEKLTNDGSGYYRIRRTYYWSKKENRPVLTDSKIKHVLITKDKLYVCISYEHTQYCKVEMGYPTAEECAMANLNGLNIVDFDEDPIDINIDLGENTRTKVIKVILTEV